MSDCQIKSERCLGLLRAQCALLKRSEGSVVAALVPLLNNCRGPHSVLLTDCGNPGGIARVIACCASEVVREHIDRHVGIGQKSQGLSLPTAASSLPPAQAVPLPDPLCEMLLDPEACMDRLPPEVDLDKALLVRLGSPDRTSAYAIVLPASGIPVEPPDPLLTALTTGAMHLQIEHLRTTGFNGGRKFAELLDNVPNIAVQGYRPDGSVVFWNRACENIYGWTEQEALGCNIVDLIVPDAMRREVEAAIDTGARTGQMPPPDEYILRHKNGDAVPVYGAHAVVDEENGERLLFCMDVDLRPIRTLEHKLAAMRERGRLVQKVVPIGYWEWDLESDLVTISSGTARLFDLPCEGTETVFTHPEIAAKILPEDREQALAKTRNAIARQEFVTFEARVAHANDGLRSLEIAGGPNSPAHSERQHFLGVVQDITDRKKMERAQEQLKAELHRRRKADSLGRLAGGIAHHLNNILTAMLGNADLLKDHVEHDSLPAELLREIETSGQRAAKIASEMLAYVGHGALLAKPVVLNGLVRDVCVQFQHALPETIRLTCDCGSADLTVSCDSARMRRVLLNLLDNAAECLEQDGGEIIVRTGTAASASETTESTDFYSVGALPANACAWFEVSDNGPGITTGEMESIFDPFYTTHLTGRGLGLPTALGIVRTHDGGIIVERKPQYGTCVRVVLPLR